jgi:hypothetical protein
VTKWKGDERNGGESEQELLGMSPGSCQEMPGVAGVETKLGQA